MTISGLAAFFACLLVAVVQTATGQIPPVRDPFLPEGAPDAAEWSLTKGYHVLRQEMEDLLPSLRFRQQRRDALYLLSVSTFEDQEYEDAFQWTSEFADEFPNDAGKYTILFYHGVSAFQTRRVSEAVRSLDDFIRQAPDHPRYGAACFWRAMTFLDNGDAQSAEQYVQKVYADSAAPAYHDVALFGWALSRERSGEYAGAIDLLEKFLTQFPESELLPDVKVRLASLYLRTGKPGLSDRLLNETDPRSNERQEYELLRAESDLQMKHYADAESGYTRFVADFPSSSLNRKARYGLAWSRLKQHDFTGAQKEFDSLGHGNDSLAFDALYQSGVLSLLQDRPGDALRRFDTLTERSPYDTYAEKAYIRIGMAQYRLKHYKESRRAFQLAARLFPESPRRAESYRMLGESSMALADYSNAQFAYSQVRRLNGAPELLAPSMFQEAVALYYLGRFKSSAEMITDYLRRFPDDERAAAGYLWKGESLFQDYRFAEAEHAYGDLLRLFPKDAKRSEALYGIAWSQFQEKKFSESAASFDRFVKEVPADNRVLEASLRRADCYFFLGQYDRAQSMYAELSSAKTDSRNVEYAAFQIAMSYVQRGEVQRGIDELRSFLNRFPGSVYNEVVQFNIGWEYFSREQYQEAIPELRTVLLKYPYSQLAPRVLFNLGDAFYNIKQYDSARIYYERVIREYPQSLLVPDALNGLQFTYEAQGKPAGALAEIDTLLAQKTVSAPQEELVLRKGDIMFAQNDFAGAIREYQNVIAMKPGSQVMAKANFQIGRAFELENNPSQAMNYYRRVVAGYAEADVAPQATLALGIACNKSRQYAEAESVLSKFQKAYPESPLLIEVLYNHGIALNGLKKGAEALAEFRGVITRFPSDVFADRSRLRMGEILHASSSDRAAIDTCTSVINRRNDDLAAEALYDVGLYTLSLKRTVEALQAFTDLIRQFTDFPYWVDRAKIGQGDAYMKLQQRKQARASYEEAIKSTDPDVRKEAQDKLKKVKR
jgi:TolA-binding protein